MSFDYSTLVRDRTQADVSARNDKGTYNAEDLNRVTAALDDLWQRLLSAGYTLPRYKRIKIDHVVPEPPSTSRLPEGYTELAWIESTGTQHINTDLYVNANTRVDIAFTAENYSPIFGVSWDDNGFFLHDWDGLGFQSGGNYAGNMSGYDRTAINNVSVTTTSVSVNGTTTAVAYSSANSTAYNLCLFCVGSLANKKATMRLYSCQIYDDDFLVRDYVPCINANGAYGLYDLVNAQFYGNAGSGNFTGGEAVAVPAVSAATTATVAEEITEYDPYLWYDIDVPTTGHMAQYLANVDDVRMAFAMLSTTPATPASMELLTWSKANNIEQILLDADTLLTALAAVYLRSGMVWGCANGPGFYFMN